MQKRLCKCKKDYQICASSQILLSTGPHKDNPTNNDMSQRIYRKEISITKTNGQTNSYHRNPIKYQRTKLNIIRHTHIYSSTSWQLHESPLFILFKHKQYMILLPLVETYQLCFVITSS